MEESNAVVTATNTKGDAIETSGMFQLEVAAPFGRSWLDDFHQAMLGFRRDKPVLESDVPVVEQPSAIAVEAPELGETEHSKLAEEVGLPARAWLAARIEAFLADNFICVYPTDRVAAYMDALTLKEQARLDGEATKAGQRLGMKIHWGWRPLLKKQRDCALEKSLPGMYAHDVPYEVLLTVKKIKDVFGKRVGFFVSDYEAVRPDPFLMVTAPGLPLYIIERWDEPGFRMA